jgi:ketosteroid isomerase-like protein
VTDEFRDRLEAAYQAWNTTKATNPAQFFELMDEAIEFHSILENELPRDPLSGPFIGKSAVIGYWTAIAESWEMVSSQADRIVTEGDTIVWVGRMHWRHRRTLRELASPKIDVWTVWNGKAIRYIEMFDSLGYARAAGLIDPPPAIESQG